MVEICDVDYSDMIFVNLRLMGLIFMCIFEI